VQLDGVVEGAGAGVEEAEVGGVCRSGAVREVGDACGGGLWRRRSKGSGCGERRENPRNSGGIYIFAIITNGKHSKAILRIAPTYLPLLFANTFNFALFADVAAQHVHFC
jgi:hypothetical protein